MNQDYSTQTSFRKPLEGITFNGQPVHTNSITGQVTVGSSGYNTETGYYERMHELSEVLEQLSRQRTAEENEFNLRRQALGTAAHIWDSAGAGDVDSIQQTYKAAMGYVPRKVHTAIEKMRQKPEPGRHKLAALATELTYVLMR